VPHQAPAMSDGEHEAGGWRATATGDRLEVTGAGSVDDWWRVVASAAWSHHDRTGSVPDVGHLDVPAE
jgi:glycerol 3-phosphatase-2